jgi:hypothetical protein
MNLFFRPIGIIAGILAGILARKLFDQSWRLIDSQQPPDPDEHHVPMGKLIVSLAMQGMIFSVVRGLVDHYSRVAFFRYTGAWPGEDDTE